MQRLLGIIGGLSPYSTIVYYKEINERYRKKTGEYPELLLASISVDRVCSLVRSGDLDGLAGYVYSAVSRLERGGAEGFLIAANTPHLVADRISSMAKIRFLNILDSVYRDVERIGARRIGLLATKETVESRLYHDYFERRGVEVIEPSRPGLEIVEKIVESVVNGLIGPDYRLKLASVANSLIARGAQAVVLGCTELPIVFQGVRLPVPVIDSVHSHVRDAVEFMMGEGEEA